MDEQPARTWGWMELAERMQTPEQAEATISFFAFLREQIARPREEWTAFPDLLPADPARDRDLSHALKGIALDPTARAAALLDLEVAVAYLRGRFALQDAPQSQQDQP